MWYISFAAKEFLLVLRTKMRSQKQIYTDQENLAVTPESSSVTTEHDNESSSGKTLTTFNYKINRSKKRGFVPNSFPIRTRSRLRVFNKIILSKTRKLYSTYTGQKLDTWPAAARSHESKTDDPAQSEGRVDFRCEFSFPPPVKCRSPPLTAETPFNLWPLFGCACSTAASIGPAASFIVFKC